MSQTVALVLMLAAGGPADDPVGPPAPAVDRNGFSLPPGAVARLGNYGLRHRYPGDWAAFSDDDRLVAFPVDGVVRIFDLDRKQDATPGYLKDFPNAVLRFLPDGRHLLFSPAAKRCEVRHPATGEAEVGFDVPNAYVDAFTPTADGKKVLVRYRDTNGYSAALVADLSEKVPTTRTLRGTSSADPWALSGDGKRLFRGWDRGVEVYDAATGERFGAANCRYRNTNWLVPNADGSKLVAGWDTGVMAFEVTADGFGEPAGTGLLTDEFAFAADGKTLVQAGRGVYDPKGAFTAVEPDHDRSALRLTRYSRTAARCIDLFNNRPPVVWNPLTGKTVHRFDGYAAGSGLGVAADGTVSIRHADRTVRVYAADGKPVADRAGRTTARGTLLLGVSPDGAAAVEYDPKEHKVSTYDTATGAGTVWPQEFATPPQAVRFDPAGRLAFVSGPGYGGVFEAATGRRVRGAESSLAAEFSADGRVLAVVGRKDVKVYEVASGKERAAIDLPATDFDMTDDDYRYRRYDSRFDDDQPRPSGTLQFSADGTRLALFWATGRVTVWDTGDGGVRYREPRMWTASRIAALRPDGDWFATTTRTQRRVALRNTADPRADRGSVMLPECKSPVVGLAFTPDGRRLVSAHEDGTGLVWDVDALLAQPRAADPDAAEALWPALASADAKVAGKAVAALVARPEVAVPLLADAAKPVAAPPAEQIQAAIKDLGDREFKVRERAEKQLRVWGDLAADDLRAAEPDANAEQGDRIHRLLEALTGEEFDPARLQLLRAVEVLERIGTPAAKAVLDKLAGGAASSTVTREAKAAGVRLKQRGR